MNHKNDTKDSFVDKLSNILIKQKSISQKEAEAMKKEFYNRSKEAFDFFLLDEAFVTKDDLLKALSEYYKVPSIDVRGVFFDHDLIRNFPKEFLLENIIIPMQIDQNMLTFVANRPDLPDLRAKINEYTDYEIELLVGEAQEIIDAIREYWDESLTYIDDLNADDEVDSKIEINSKGIVRDLDEIEKKERY